ncbi:hypothetical protein ONZ45_g16129 [Pleurotus djamor]|nr:hypothetical protein ONZ45_g16129 [Pleurotus djamor]
MPATTPSQLPSTPVTSLAHPHYVLKPHHLQNAVHAAIYSFHAWNIPQLASLGPELRALFEDAAVRVTSPRNLTGKIKITDASALQQAERLLFDVVEDVLCGIYFCTKLGSRRELLAKQVLIHVFSSAHIRALMLSLSPPAVSVSKSKGFRAKLLAMDAEEQAFLWEDVQADVFLLAVQSIHESRPHETRRWLLNLVLPHIRFIYRADLNRSMSFVAYLMGLGTGFCSEVTQPTGQKRSRSSSVPASSLSKIPKSAESTTEPWPSTSSPHSMDLTDTAPSTGALFPVAVSSSPSSLGTSGFTKDGPRRALVAPKSAECLAPLTQATLSADALSLPESLHETTNPSQNISSGLLVPSIFDVKSLPSKLKSVLQGLQSSPSSGLFGFLDTASQARQQPLLPTVTATTGVVGLSNRVSQDPSAQPLLSTAMATSARPCTVGGGANSASASSSPLEVRQPAATSSLKRGRDAAHLDPITSGDYAPSKRRNVRCTP